MKRPITLIACAIALIGAAACGQEETRAAVLAELDRQIPRLPPGASIADVEDRLGPPREEPTELEDGEESLFYSRWHLVFDPGLVSRLRYYKGGYWPPQRPVAPLDRKVKELNLGLSKKAVEAEVGKTEAWEIRIFHEREYVWYGNGRWRLGLVDQQLASRWFTQ
jgi:hypothetical protein